MGGSGKGGKEWVGVDLAKIDPIRKPGPNPPETFGFEHDFFDLNLK